MNGKLVIRFYHMENWIMTYKERFYYWFIKFTNRFTRILLSLLVVNETMKVFMNEIGLLLLRWGRSVLLRTSVRSMLKTS